MKFEELQGKRVVFSGEGVPLSIRTKTWQAGDPCCEYVPEHVYAARKAEYEEDEL